MVNIRPIQTKPIPWPWTNKLVDGRVYTVEHLARDDKSFPMSLCPFFDWTRYEISARPDIGNEFQLCSCDMKSILTTARRAYGDERLYTLLLDGVDPFEKIFNLFDGWNRMLLLAFPGIEWFVIGDDLAHSNSLFYPPWITNKVIEYQRELCRVARLFGVPQVAFHSAGKLPKYLANYLTSFQRVIIEGDNNRHLTADNEALQRIVKDHSHDALTHRIAYPAQEEFGCLNGL